MATLRQLYDSLRADGAPLPDTYEKFRDYMTSGPNKGYDHRKQVYDSLKADGAPLPDTYEEFSKALFRPVKNNQAADNSQTATQAPLNIPTFEEFSKARSTPLLNNQTVDTPQTESDSTPEPQQEATDNQEGGWSPMELTRIRLGGPLPKIGGEGNTILDRYTPQGRTKLKKSRQMAQITGAPTRVIGIDPMMSAGTESTVQPTGQSDDDGYVSQNRDHVVPYDVQWVDGKPQTRWLLPDGRVTTDRWAAENAEGHARNVRLQDEFVGRMKYNGLDPAKQEDVERQTQLDYESQLRSSSSAYARSDAFQLNEARRELVDLIRKRKEYVDDLQERQHQETHWYDVIGGTYGSRQVDMPYDDMVRGYDAAIRQAHQRVQMLENKRDQKNSGNSFWRDFWRGTSQAVTDVSAWDFGATDITNSLTYLKMKQKVDEGKELSEGEKAAMESYILNEGISQALGDMGRGYRWGNITGSSLSFMKDFILTGGFSGLGGIVTKGLAKGVVGLGGSVARKQLIREVSKRGLMGFVRDHGARGLVDLTREEGLRWTVKALGTTAEDLLVRAPLMAGTVQGFGTASKIIDAHTGTPAIAEDGSFTFADGQSWSQAAWEQGADQVIENFSEMWGAHLPGVTEVTRAFGARNLTAAILRATREGAGSVLSKTSALLRKAGMDGYFGEVGEEYYGQLWRTMLNLESAKDGQGNNNFLNGEFHGDIWGGMALSVGLTGAMATAGHYATGKATESVRYLRNRHAVNKADARASTMFSADEWKDLRDIIDMTSNSEIGKFVDNLITDNDMTDRQKQAVMDYLEASLKYRGYNLGEMLCRSMEVNTSDDNTSDDNTSDDNTEDINDSYLEGYDITEPGEMAEVKKKLDLRRRRLESSMSLDMIQEFDADPISALSRITEPELRQIALDYVNAKQVYDGMMQRVSDDVDARIAHSDAVIDGHVNQDTGMIHPASMGEDDRDVYIVHGNVVMNDDGSVDSGKSSESIIIRDAKTGKIEYADPLDVISLGEPVDAGELKEHERSRIMAESREAADKAQQEVATPAAGAASGTTGQAADGSYNTVPPVVAAEWLIGSGENAIKSADYLLKALSGVFSKANQGIENLRIKRQLRGDIDDFVGTEEYQEVMDEIRALLRQAYGNDSDAVAILDDILKYPRGLPYRYGQMISKRLDALEQAAATDGAGADTGVESQASSATTSTDDGFIPIDSSQLPSDPFAPFDPAAAPAPAAGAASGQQPSALSQIPTDQAGNPIYEQVCPETAWDALMEECEDEQVAQNVIAQEIAEREDALKKMERQKPKAGLTTREKIKAEKDKKQAMDAIRRSIDHWKRMAAVAAQRKAAAEAAQSQPGQPNQPGPNGAEAPAQDQISGEGVIDGSSDNTGQEAQATQTQLNQEEQAQKQAEEETQAQKQAEEELRQKQEEEKWRKQKQALDRRVRAVAEKYRDVQEVLELLGSLSPMSIDEVAAYVLSRNRVLWSDTVGANSGIVIKAGVPYHTGIGEAERRKLIGLFASEAKGGKSIERLAEDVFKEVCEEHGIRYDNQEALDALIDMILGARTRGDINNYILNKRLQQAEEIGRQARERDEQEAELYYQERYGMSREDYEAYEEEHAEQARNHFENFDEPEFYRNIADDIINRQRQEDELRRNQAAVASAEGAAGSGGNEVLPQSRSAQASGDPGTEGAAPGSGGRAGHAVSDQDGGLQKGASGGLSTGVTTGLQAAVEAASAAVNTAPSEAQKAAGNYKKGHVTIGDFEIAIENPAGSVRRGTDADGNAWQSTMHNAYGYIKGTESADGDPLDVFLNTDMDAWNGRKVFVVDQYNPDGTLDEHKVMLGFNDRDEAFNAYLSNYEKDWEKGRRLDVTEANLENFEKWIDSSHRKTKAFAEYKSVKAIGSNDGMFGYFKGSMQELINNAKENAKGLIKKIISPISNRLRSDLAAKGIEIDDEYRHVIDNNAIRHTLKQHGGRSENKRGQIPVTDEDFQRLEEIVSDYDRVEVEQGKRGNDNIIYSKTYSDGTTIFVEEKRVGRKELAAVTMWKKKKSTRTDANHQEGTPISDLSGKSEDKGNDLSGDKQAPIDKNKAYEEELSAGAEPSAQSGQDGKTQGAAKAAAGKRVDVNGVLGAAREYEKARDDRDGIIWNDELSPEEERSIIERETKARETLTGLVDRLTDEELYRLILDEHFRSIIESTYGPVGERVARIVKENAYRMAYDTADIVEPAPRSKSRRKFSITEATSAKSDVGNYTGVHHLGDDKVAVATDGVVLVMSEEDYSPEDAGRMVTKKGKSQGWNVPWRKIIQRSGKPVAWMTVSREKCDAVEGLLRALKGKGTLLRNGRRRIPVAVRIGKDSYGVYDLQGLSVMLRAVHHLGLGDVYMYENGMLVATGKRGACALVGGMDKGEVAAARLNLSGFKDDIGADGKRFHRDVNGSAAGAQGAEARGHDQIIGDGGHGVYEAAKGLVEAAGIEVVEVSDAEAQAMAEGHEKTPVAGQPNRANEKLTSGSVLAAHGGGSSSSATDSRKLFAKIEKDTQSAKNKIQKFNNGDYRGDYSTVDKAISSIASMLTMRNKGGSRYAVLQTDGGSTVAVRLSDHGANGNNFRQDGTDRNLSIVIERRKYDTPDSELEFTEVTIPEATFMERSHDVVSAIVKGVEDVLADRDFTMDSSLGTVEKKGGDMMMRPDIRARELKDGTGRVYGWTDGKKVYLNRGAMNPQSPVHEYTHLWDEMVRKENPELWERGKELMKQLPLWDEVVNDSAYADIRYDEDAVASEVHSRLSGERGARMLEQMLEDAKKDGPMAVAEKVTLVQRLKAWLGDMFRALRKTLGQWSGRELDELTAEDFADMTLRDLAEGLNPQAEIRRGRVARDVMEANPMLDDYHRGVRSRDDVMTYDEVLAEAEEACAEYGDLTYPDMDIEILRDARESGRITVYSSKPIETGVFVTPSRMNAEDYAGGGRVYSKEVDVDEVAWTGEDEGQYTPEVTDGVGSEGGGVRFDRGRVARDRERRQDYGPGLFDNEAGAAGAHSRVRLGQQLLINFGDDGDNNTRAPEPSLQPGHDDGAAAEANARIDEFVERAAGIFGRYGLYAAQRPELTDSLMERMDAELMDEGERLRAHLEDYYRSAGNSAEDCRRMARDMAGRVIAETTLRLAPEVRMALDEARLSRVEASAAGNDGDVMVTAGGEAVTFRTARDEDMGAAGAAAGKRVDAEPLRRLGPGEYTHVERRFTATGEFGFTGSERIESVEDVAYLFRCLEDYSIENTFAVLVKDGHATIVHLGMGAATMSPVDMAALRGSVDAFGADEVYFVHNHPSGNLRPSPQDRKILQRAVDMLGADRVRDGVIIDVTSGRYSTFGTESGHNESQRDDSARADDRVYGAVRMDRSARSAEGKDVASLPVIKGSMDVAALVSGKRLGREAKVNYLLLAHNGRVIGNLHTAYSSYGEDVAGLADEMVRMGVRHGATSVIPYGNVEMKPSDMRRLQEAVSRLSGESLRMLDALEIDSRTGGGYRSAMDNGMVNEPEEDISSISKKFIDDLERFQRGELDERYRFELGRPSEYLLSAGFPDLPISMRQSLVRKKSAMDRHRFSPASLMGLVEAIQKPLAIFEYSKANMRNLIVDLKEGENHFLVGVTLNYKAGDIEINSVSGLFPKDNAEWLKWIQNGKAIRIDGKEKIQAIIDSQRTTNTVESERIGLNLDDTAKIVEKFENPPMGDQKILERPGDKSRKGAPTPGQRDPWRLPWGEAAREKLRMEQEADNLRRRLKERAQNVAESLGVDVEIIEDAGSLTGARRNARGWYDTATGKISIVTGNHRDEADIEATLLHEIVAHRGLRELFGERFDAFLDAVYRHADNRIKERIDVLAIKNGWNRRVATEEYLVGLTEDGAFKKAGRSWWQKLKGLFKDFLRSCGFSTEMPLSDNELRYVLWMSWQNLKYPGKFKGLLGLAERVAKEYELKTGPYKKDSRERMNEAEPDANIISRANKKFNDTLERYQRGSIKTNEVFELGMPQRVLRHFLPNLPIVMRQRILNKGSNKKHDVDVSTLRNMPAYLSSPIFIFKRDENTLGILTEMKDRNGLNVCVAIELSRAIQNGREMIEVNDIRSIHGRRIENIISPILTNGTLKWADKEKGLEWLSSAITKSQEIATETKNGEFEESHQYPSSASPNAQQEMAIDDFDSAAKIVRNFENPTTDDGIMYRDVDFTPRDRRLVADKYERMVSSGSYQFREAVQDSMLGLRKLYEAISGKQTRIEDIAGYENAYLYENRMSSSNNGEGHDFLNERDVNESYFCSRF